MHVGAESQRDGVGRVAPSASRASICAAISARTGSSPGSCSPASSRLRTSWCSTPEKSSPRALNRPGRGGTTMWRMPSSARQPGRVDGARAAEGQQREVARVAAALGRHLPQGPHGADVGDLVDAFGRPQQVQPQRLGDAVNDGLRRGRGIDPDLALAEVAGADVAQHHIGVGDGGFAAAEPIAGRTGLGPGAARPHPQAARSRKATLPPPAPTSAMSMVGARISSPPPPSSWLPADSVAPTSYWEL